MSDIELWVMPDMLSDKDPKLDIEHVISLTADINRRKDHLTHLANHASLWDYGQTVHELVVDCWPLFVGSKHNIRVMKTTSSVFEHFLPEHRSFNHLLHITPFMRFDITRAICGIMTTNKTVLKWLDSA